VPRYVRLSTVSAVSNFFHELSKIRCGPCKVIAPKFEEWQKEFPDIEFVKVDVDDADDVAAECGIRAMPTFHFYKGGAKVKEVVGADPNNLLAVIKELM
jgi:thioredoxin 1